MIDNDLHTVFPWYTDCDYQNHRRDWCYEDTCTWKLLTAQERLLPFQIRHATSGDPLIEMKLYCLDGTEAVSDNLLDYIPAGDIDVEVDVGGWDYIIYYGQQDLLYELPCGTYYLTLTDGTLTWCSEVFTVEAIVDDTTVDYRTTDDGSTLRITDGDTRIVT